MLIDQPIPIIGSIAALAGRYSAWLCDIWGVIHNGVAPFPKAVEACRTFRQGGGVVVLITNAPRPRGTIAHILSEMGIGGDAYDAIVTSGDVTLSLLRERPGVRIFHIGPPRDEPMFEGLDVVRVQAAQAELILNTGPYDDDNETPEDYRALLETLSERRIPMICANPDLRVERGGKLIYCAGALAALYEDLGGQVTYAGKPFAPIYELALAEIAARLGRTLPPSQVLGIGDGLNTDIKGAHDFGMDAVYIASQVHLESTGQDLTPSAVSKLFSAKTFRPIAAQAALAW